MVDLNRTIAKWFCLGVVMVQATEVNSVFVAFFSLYISSYVFNFNKELGE